MDVFSAPRLGLIVPPENPTAEPELGHYLGSAMRLYTSRFPVTPGLGLRDMLDTYNEVLPEVLAGFGRLRLDAVVVACNASHYLLSPDGDREFCAELSERTGFPVQSSSLAILDACAVLGVSRFNLVSPYERWLTDESRSYWEAAGLVVDRVVQVAAGDRYDPYQVTTRQILDELRRQELDPRVPLLFTGTGMFTLGALRTLAADPGRTLLATNLVSAWWGLRMAGAPAGGHPLLRRLVAGRLSGAKAEADPADGDDPVGAAQFVAEAGDVRVDRAS